MKKLIIAVIAISFLLFSVGIIAISVIKKEEQDVNLQKISRFENRDFSYINKSVPKQNTQLIFFFSSTCGLCDYEAEIIMRKIDKFKETDFIWVSNQINDSVVGFAKRNKIWNKQGIYLATIADSVYNNKYMLITPPHSLLYYKGKYINQYKGIKSPSFIIDDIKKIRYIVE